MHENLCKVCIWAIFVFWKALCQNNPKKDINTLNINPKIQKYSITCILYLNKHL